MIASYSASNSIAALNNNITYADLLSIERPAQYLGGEVNSIYKSPAPSDVRIALAFPDSYEVGMSHAGLHLLYQIANSLDYCWAERAFMPLPDMENLLREKGTRLFSLESATALADFDALGFTLQYELSATNILAMLDLGGIPLRSDDRNEEHPIVIGGGSYAMHAAPLAPFFDIFFLGEAEHGLEQIAATIWQHKTSPEPCNRQRLLAQLCSIDGVMSAKAYENLNSTLPAQVVKRQTLAQLNNEAYLNKPIIAHSRIIHDRLPIELMRGCVRGCRFCQAGFLYRPLRERSPDEVLKIVQESLANSGFEEIGLLSLSTADYCALSPLLETLMDSFAADNRVSISLPSTRVDAVRPEIMQQIARVRKTGFTLAPEGGSERMRQVINKGLTEEEILKACRQVFEAGWDSIKLYFMIGLPSETDEDVLAIAELAKKIKTLPEAKGRALTVSASTFIPKPHTPFQWAEQISADEAYRRQEILKTELRKIGVKFRYQRTFPSVLEGLLARGGTELAEVIVDAYQRGARFEAWDEHRREDIWRDVLEHHEIDLGVAFRERSISEKLPWDCTTGTVSRSFLLKEWQQARQGKQTQSCLHSNCSNCGVCGGELGNIRFPILEEVPPRPAPSPERQVVKQRIRLKFAKVGPLALVSHLELAGLFQRCCRRARLPIAYSEGFHPLPRVVFGPPLQLGIASLAEYVDLYLIEQTSPQGLISSLQALLPKGMSIEDAQEIDLSAPSISESVRVQRFEIMSDMSFLGFSDPNRLGEYFTDKAAIDDLIVSSYLETLIERDAKVSHQKRGKRRKVKKAKSFLLREHLSNLEFYPSVENSEVKAFFDLKFQPQIASPKPFEIAKLLTSRTPKDYWLLKTRMELDPQVGKDQALI